MSRQLDTRRLSDVKPRPLPTPEEFYGDPQLAAYGYSGEASTYRLRINRIHELAAEGRGPMAWLKDFLASCAAGAS